MDRIPIESSPAAEPPGRGPLDGFLISQFFSVSRDACVREELNQVRLAQSDSDSTHLQMAEASLRDELARIEEHAPAATPTDKVAAAFIAVNGESLNFLEVQNATGLTDVALHSALADLVHSDTLRTIAAGDGITYWEVIR